MTTDKKLLSIRGLEVVLRDPGNPRALVRGLDLDIKPQSIVALVGGSGSGKTTTGLSILGLLPPALHVRKGQIIFKGEDLLTLPESRLQHIRGKEIGMVFQEPLNAFNPVFEIGSQIEEVLKTHTPLKSLQREKRIWKLLEMVGILDPVRVCKSYPHQLSGGMRQRAMIAQAIAAEPQLLIADEPTSNLDVTLQARIIELFRKLKDELKLSILLITHDLGVVEHLADEVAVLSGGQVVESGPTSRVLKEPKHAFTRQLMDIMTI